MRRLAFAVGGLLIIAAPLWAGYKVNVTAPEGFEERVSRVAVVTTECGEALNCREIENQVREVLRGMSGGWYVVPGTPTHEAFLVAGAVSYDPEMRQALAEELEVDGFLELTLPRGEKGVMGWKGSEATVRLKLVTPSGEILMAGERIGRARNTLSSPENIARATVKRILKKAFR